jgi:hypothetical protein
MTQAIDMCRDDTQGEAAMYEARLHMSNADGTVAFTKAVELDEPPRPGARLRGHFANATLEVTRVVLDGSGFYEVFVAVCVLDFIPAAELEPYYTRSGWTSVDPFDEDTDVNFTLERLE